MNLSHEEFEWFAPTRTSLLRDVKGLRRVLLSCVLFLPLFAGLPFFVPFSRFPLGLVLFFVVLYVPILYFVVFACIKLTMRLGDYTSVSGKAYANVMDWMVTDERIRQYCSRVSSMKRDLVLFEYDTLRKWHEGTKNRESKRQGLGDVKVPARMDSSL